MFLSDVLTDLECNLVSSLTSAAKKGFYSKSFRITSRQGGERSLSLHQTLKSSSCGNFLKTHHRSRKLTKFANFLILLRICFHFSVPGFHSLVKLESRKFLVKWFFCFLHFDSLRPIFIIWFSHDRFVKYFNCEERFLIAINFVLKPCANFRT